MKQSFLMFLLLFSVILCKAQDLNKSELLEGTVSFLSSKNVYVKFTSTEKINKGDTLFMRQEGQLISALLVENKSSSSTVCTPIGNIKLVVNDRLFAQVFIPASKPVVKEETSQPARVNPRLEINNDPVVKPEEDDPLEEILFKEKIRGRISAASYNNFSGYNNATRMRYAFSLRAQHLNNSKLSVDSYVTFRHQLNDSINFADALKVYSLSAKYEFNRSTHLTFGRKINPKFSSMGAIDGLQFEKGFGNISLGFIAGTRPDFQDYGLNLNLLQFGAYASITSIDPSITSTTTLGLINQMNSGNTDRRFAYFQHSSNLAKNLNLFGSFELDLFENINEQVKNTAKLTNLYVSVRYRMSRKLRLSMSYDNRRNIIYYESYKNFIDQLIEDETRQGFRFGISHRATKYISWGVNTGFRFQKSSKNPSQNLNGHVSFSKVPFINARATLRANLLKTDFLNSKIFGLRLSKSIIRNKVDVEAYYRWVDYKYLVGDRVLDQNIAGANVSFRVQKNMSIHLFYEGVFDNSNKVYHRFNTRIIKRF